MVRSLALLQLKTKAILGIIELVLLLKIEPCKNVKVAQPQVIVRLWCGLVMLACRSQRVATVQQELLGQRAVDKPKQLHAECAAIMMA